MERSAVTTKGFYDFFHEAHSKTSSATGGCANPSNCRNMNEILYIAYGKAKIIQEKLKMDHLFIFTVKPNLDFGGVSQVVMTSPQMPLLKTKNMDSSIIFK